MPRRRATAVLLAVVGLLSFASLPPAKAASGVTTDGRFRATIVRSAYGIPHITASSYAGVGFGYAYAFVHDNVCTMANDYVTLSARRSLTFGKTGTVTSRGVPYTVNNLDSDLFWQQVIANHTVEKLVAMQAPRGPEQAARDGVRGYVAGWNKALKDLGGANGIKDPACHGKSWVRPITEIDVWRRFFQLAILASQNVAEDGIAEAQPPIGGVVPVIAGVTGASPAQKAALLSKKLAKPLGGLGSNAVAIGSAGTRNHTTGLLLGNPHFPWEGTERFYQVQLTIPGQVDVTGSTLYGVPVVLIGHTKGFAWSHTVSTAYRFTPYQLTLVPGTPTSYLYDDVPTKMTSITVTVPTGGGASTTRILYSTRFGPVINSLEATPVFPWTTATAFAMRDANAMDLRYINHFLDTDRAQNVADEVAVLHKYTGLPWVNILGADSHGHTLYGDVGTIPHVTDAQARSCNTALGAALFATMRLPVLDGSKSSCNWGNDPDSRADGIFGTNELPMLQRSDFETNSNDSYWLSNPAQPLTGFPQIIGSEKTARTLRTRSGIVMVQKRISGVDGFGPAGFTRQDMQDLLFRNTEYSAELVRNDAVTLCRSLGATAPTSGGGTQPMGKACDVLAKWDVRDNPSSVGALLFRRFWTHAQTATPSPWRNAFNASDAANTPNTLETNNPVVKLAIGDALADLKGTGLTASSPLSANQYLVRAGSRIAIPGGPGDHPDTDTFGSFDVQNMTWKAKTGYANALPDFGSSFIQVVSWKTPTSCPDSVTMLTYSESDDISSPHYADQTKLYSQGKWVPDSFCPKATAAVHKPSSSGLPTTGASAWTALLGLVALTGAWVSRLHTRACSSYV
jgi:acyl-homoserine-lactone acylase